MIQNFAGGFAEWLAVWVGVGGEWFAPFYTCVVVLCYIFGSALIYYVLSGPIAYFARGRARRTKTNWDDRLLAREIVRPLLLLMLLYFWSKSAGFLFELYPSWLPSVKKILDIAMIATGAFLATSAVRVVYVGMREDEVDIAGLAVARNVINTAIIAVAILLSLSTILSRNLAYIVSGLGAMAAVLSLIFKDSIVGMIAGIRLVANKMVKHDDWIIAPIHNINGRVMDVTLTAVKVKNWDNSISTVPPHALVSNGFQNMEQMLNEGSRRVERCLNIDVNSVRTISPHELGITDEESLSLGYDPAKPVVNLTLWRRAVKRMIENHPLLQPEPRYMVRELETGADGIPVEVHFFVRCINWEEFEELQADFTDALLASAGVYGLRVFQHPSGSDIAALMAS